MAKPHKEIIRKVKDAAGEAFLPHWQWEELSVDGSPPIGVVSPDSPELVAKLVQICRHGEVRLVPAGSRHQLSNVHAKIDKRPVLVLTTEALNQVIAHTFEDMTIRVQSGARLAQVDEATHQYGQHLPIDPPFAETATVGGMVATNACGPRRLMHGTASDAILGGAMVMADGSTIRSGADTVKSVAGYDLHKLFVGSFGALGIVTELTLKLKPIPEDFRIAQIQASSMADAAYIAGQLIRGETRPCLMELFEVLAARELGLSLAAGQSLLLVGYEDTPEAVDWQLSQVQATLGEYVTPLDQDTSLELHRHMVEWPRLESDYAFEAALLGTEWDQLMEYCAAEGIVAVANVGSSLVYGRGMGALKPQTAEELRRLTGAGGSLRFTKLPPRCEVSAWGDMDQARKWMRVVKEELDPQCIFPWPGFLGS